MAFQTSCAAGAETGGLLCAPDIAAGADGRELVQHGSALFPIACYAEDLESYAVAWHWHEEFEYILAVQGPLNVNVGKTRLTLQTGQGVLINSGVLHAVEQAGTSGAMLHSGVFHPRLVGGMDTIFWQKLIRPLLQPGAPAFFWLEEEEPRQRQVLAHLRNAWNAVAEEPFDYENQVRYHLSAALRPLLQPGAPAFFWLEEEEPRQRQVLAHLRNAWNAVAEEPFDYENQVRYHLSAALRLLSIQCADEKRKVSRQEQIAAERMKQMLRFVEEHYAEELTVERIAADAALSESACLRSFRQVLGITPIQYVKQFRVEKAAELLRFTQLKTGEIGAECGFADGSYFIKTFREIKHCTPKEYRKRFEKE